MKQLKPILLLSLTVLLYLITGIQLERFAIIEDPAIWALYGLIFGVLISEIINYDNW